MKHGMKPMLIFLQYIIKKITTLNLEFQSEHFCLHMFYFYVTAKYKSILSCFIRREIVAEKIFPKSIPAIVTITNTLLTFSWRKNNGTYDK